MTPVLGAWLVVSVLGLGYTLLNHRSAWKDRRAQRALGRDGVLGIVTTANLRREWTRLAFWALALLVGLAAWLDLTGEWVGWALVGIMALQVFNSYMDRRERVQVRRLG